MYDIISLKSLKFIESFIVYAFKYFIIKFINFSFTLYSFINFSKFLKDKCPLESNLSDKKYGLILFKISSVLFKLSFKQSQI